MSTSPLSRERQLEETTRQMEIVKNSRVRPPPRLRKRKKKGGGKKEGKKKEGERKIERSEDSTRPMNYARVCIQGKLTGRYAIIRSHLGKRWLLRSPPTGNYHGGK